MTDVVRQWITFERTVEGTLLLAAYLAELTKQCVCYVVRQDKFSVDVALTGGF